MTENEENTNTWWVYQGAEKPHSWKLPAPPSWREFRPDQQTSPESSSSEKAMTIEHDPLPGIDVRGAKFQVSKEEKDLINAALYLRRPLFVTGKPGCGKSLLPYAVAYELGLGPVLRWPITSRVTLQDGLYHYDAIGRLQDSSLNSKEERKVPPIGDYLRLGPLGTALLPSSYPRVLLIDEIDKSDIDLPNDLLNIFEEGEYDIPELARLSKAQARDDSSESELPKGVAVMPYDGKDETNKVAIEGGHVRCTVFPFVVLTSNEEREFPPAFLRRCIRMRMEFPDPDKLTNIVKAHLGKELHPRAEQLINEFIERGKHGDLAADQLLNAVYLIARDDIKIYDQETMLKTLWHYLSSSNIEA